MVDLERSERLIISILIASLLIGCGIILYRKYISVGDLRIERAAPVGQAPRDITKKSGKININEASAEMLMSLKGVGKVLAGRIVEYRTKSGSFITADDLKKVPGIGEVLFSKIKDSITLE